MCHFRKPRVPDLVMKNWHIKKQVRQQKSEPRYSSWNSYDFSSSLWVTDTGAVLRVAEAQDE